VKYRDLRKLLRDAGWVKVRQRGSHEQYRRPFASGRVTVSGADGEEVPRGTLNSILKQAGLK
jgi:predicted RNA binding protein YcfA (HicA-like mRNA interferase family)